MAGAGGAGGMTGGNDQLIERATELDTICAEDCAKDVMCNEAQAPPVMDCVQMYCGFADFYADVPETDGLVACLDADLALSRCIVALSCEDYSAYYYEDLEAGFPCEAEDTAYTAACQNYVE